MIKPKRLVLDEAQRFGIVSNFVFGFVVDSIKRVGTDRKSWFVIQAWYIGWVWYILRLGSVHMLGLVLRLGLVYRLGLVNTKVEFGTYDGFGT